MDRWTNGDADGGYFRFLDEADVALMAFLHDLTHTGDMGNLAQYLDDTVAEWFPSEPHLLPRLSAFPAVYAWTDTATDTGGATHSVRLRYVTTVRVWDSAADGWAPAFQQVRAICGAVASLSRQTPMGEAAGGGGAVGTWQSFYSNTGARPQTAVSVDPVQHEVQDRLVVGGSVVIHWEHQEGVTP